MNHKELKQKIVDKFGSVGRFVRVAELDKNSVRAILARSDNNINDKKKRELDDFLKIVKRTSASKVAPDEISEDDRAAINLIIVNQFGDVQNFCYKNPQFSTTTVYQIIDGLRKRKTEIVQNLMDVLEKATQLK